MTTPDIPSLVESVLRLDKEATNGPWSGKVFQSSLYSCPDIVDERSDCIAMMDSLGARIGPETIKANSRWIIYTRTAAPILARACNEKDEEITHLRAELAEEKRKVGLALLPVVDDVKAREGHQYEEENWNPDCHVQLELTVREFRAIRDILAALTTPSEKGEL